MCRISPIVPLADDALEFAHRGEAALVVAAAEHDAGRAAGFDRARSLRARQCQRLLAPHRLARLGHGPHLLDMKRMRRGQEHGLHLRVGQRIREIGGQSETVSRGEVARLIGLFADAVYEAQPCALALHGIDQRLAPTPEADDGSIDHVANVRQSR
jgi:hypothetical protein